VSSRVYRLRQVELTSVDADDELVALDLQKSLYLGVNSSGRALWRRLATDATEADLVTLLAETYGITAEVAARDVRAFLADLDEAGLLA
jgi:hypothetical protein